jgi:membrane protein
MLLKRAPLKFWLNAGATALLVGSSLWPPGLRGAPKGAKTDRPFGEPQSSEEPYEVELRRARERGCGREAIHPLQIPWRGWYDVVWRTYREMQSDRLLSISGGVSFFVLLAIFPAITALVSAYGLLLALQPSLTISRS